VARAFPFLSMGGLMFVLVCLRVFGGINLVVGSSELEEWYRFTSVGIVVCVISLL